MEYLQLHYYLENGIHSMDAFVINKAESELLKIFKQISKILEIEEDVSFETIAINEGGIRAFYRFINKKKNRKKINNALIFLGGIIAAVVTNVISDKLTSDPELENLQKEELRLKIEQLKKQRDSDENHENQTALLTEDVILFISKENKVKIFKSNFYSTLANEGKIESISTQLLDSDKKPISREKKVSKDDFKKFIIHSKIIPPDFRENETVEIVAPVLKKGSIKWKGTYDSKPISFNMRDSDFKVSVLNGEMSFTSGLSIICDIEFEQSIDDEGDIKIESINVYNVTQVIIDSKKIETNRKRVRRESENQTRLDFD